MLGSASCRTGRAFVLLLVAAVACAASAQKPAAGPPAPTAEARKAEARFAQAVKAMQARDFDTALSLFREVATRYPNAPAWLNMAAIYRERGETKNAEAAYLKALAVDPNEPNGLRGLSELLIAQQRWPAAAKYLRRAIARRPNDAVLHAVLGDVEYRLGDRKAAEARWLEALRRDSGLLAARRNLISLYSETKRDKEMRTQLQALTKAAPDDANAHFSLGVVNARLDQPREALASFRRVLALRPGHASARVNAARLEMQLGQMAAAATLFQQIVKDDPANAEALFALGVIAFEAKDWPGAVSRFRAVLATPSAAKMPGARINLATALMNQDEFAEAAAEFEKALTENPKNADVYHSLAYTYQRQMQNDKANEVYRRLLKVDPDNVPALQALAAGAHFGTGGPAVAIPYYERILKILPNHENTVRMLAMAYAAQSEIAKAVALYDPLLPKHPEYRGEVARILSQAGEKEEAIATLQAWSKARPDAMEPWIALGDAHRDAEEWDEAQKAYDAAKRAAPNNAQPWIGAARAYQRQNRNDDALEELASAPAGASGIGAAHRLAGDILQADKKVDEAIAQYRLAIQADPEMAYLRQNIARALLDAGKPGEAAEEYRRLLAADPRDLGAQRGLAQALEKAGDPAGAIAAWRQTMEADANSSAGAVEVARIQQETGQPREAVATLAGEAVRRPGDPAVAAALVRTGDETGQMDAVLAALNEAAEKAPDHPLVFTHLASAYKRLDEKNPVPEGVDPDAPRPAAGLEVLKNYMRRFPGNESLARATADYATSRNRWDAAADAYRRVVEMRPDDAATHASLADALARSDRATEAESLLREALVKEPSNVSLRLALAAILERQNKDQVARAEYENALQLAPDNAEAQAGLERIKAPIGSLPTPPLPATTPDPPRPAAP